MLTALLIVASLSVGPAPVAVHPAPAVTNAAVVSQAVQIGGAQTADFPAWLGLAPAAATPSLGFEPIEVACRTSCLQCPKSAPFCCVGVSGCVSCTTRPTPCIQ